MQQVTLCKIHYFELITHIKKENVMYSFMICLDTVYFAENWKYYSKIIFKCVNSAVRPIFNEKVTEKWDLWVYKQCTRPINITEKSNITT